MSSNTNKKSLPDEKERWELFYNLTKDVFNREEKRYERIEEKASSCLTAFSLLLVIYGFLWKHVLDNVIPPECTAEIILSVFSVLLILLFIVSWIFAFQVFQTEKRKVMPLHEDMVKYFEQKNKKGDRSIKFEDLYYNLGIINKEAYEHNCKLSEKEIKKFKTGSIMMLISAISLIIFIIMYATYLWC